MHTEVLIESFLKYNRKDEIHQHSGGICVLVTLPLNCVFFALPLS